MEIQSNDYKMPENYHKAIKRPQWGGTSYANIALVSHNQGCV